MGREGYVGCKLNSLARDCALILGALLSFLLYVLFFIVVKQKYVLTGMNSLEEFKLTR